MRLNDLLRVSVRQVLRYRRRYWSVILAIALGTAGFITIITMGRDLKKNFNRDLELLGGATQIRVYFDNLPAYESQWFNHATQAALRQIPGVNDVSVVASTYGAVATWGEQRYTFMLLGVDNSFWNANGLSTLAGQMFQGKEINERHRVCILGPELARKIFGNVEVTGKILPIQGDLYQVTGVLNGAGLGDRTFFAFIPLTTAQDRIYGLSQPNRIYLRCNTWDDVDKVAPRILPVIQATQPMRGVKVEVAWDQLKRIKAVAWWVELFIYCSITATLILGGVGIWNVMMAAVRSRTREIGLKKAMGAEDRDILAQFLTESLCLSLGSALVGMGLGRIAVEIMGVSLGIRPPETLFLLCMALGFLFALFLGVGAGLYPSIQASRMEVVSAIRYE